MNRVWASLLCLASLGAAAEAPEDYAYVLPIEGVGSDALYRVVVPRVVHEAAAFPDLRDLRVFNGAGQVVAHALLSVAAPDRTPAPVALPFYALQGPRGARVEDLDIAMESSAGRANLKVRSRYRAAGQWALLGYLIDASQLKEPLSGLEVDWIASGGDYSAVVHVEGSDDLKLWTALGEDAQLLGLTRGTQRVDRKAIAFRPSRAKFLRIAWSDPARARELKTVLGIVAGRGAQSERVWKRLVARLDTGSSVDYRIDAGGLFPLDRLELRLPREESVVPVGVFSRAEAADEWKPVARVIAYRLKQGELEIANTDISFAPNTHRYWLLRTDESGGGVGAERFVVRAGWIPREIVFAASGGAPYSLAYGNASAKAVALPIETLVPGWRTEQAPTLRTAATGAPRRLDSGPAAGERIDTERASLWAALGVGLATLIWLSWRRRRQAHRSESEST